jgi:hypothetical protein
MDSLDSQETDRADGCCHPKAHNVVEGISSQAGGRRVIEEAIEMEHDPRSQQEADQEEREPQPTGVDRPERLLGNENREKEAHPDQQQEGDC